MFMGHYAVALATHAKQPRLPLWVYMGAVQWLDLLWAVLVLSGIEKIRLDSSFATTPVDMYFIPYSHGLPMAIFWSVIMAGLGKWAFRVNWATAGLLGWAVFSHWLLDLLVHHADLALGVGDIKLGLGLWNYPVLSGALEMGLIGLGGMYGLMWGNNRHQNWQMMWLVVLLMGIQLLSYALPFPATPSEMAWGVLLTHLAVIGVSVYLGKQAV